MRRAHRARLRAAVLATMTVAAAVLGFGAGPASADVDTVSGSAFAVSVNSSLLGQVLAPTPAGIAGSATEPTNAFGPIVAATLPINVPGILTANVGPVSTQGGDVAGENHLGFATSQASVANVVLGSPLSSILTATTIRSSCRSDGNGSVGTTELVGATLAGNPLLTNPTANTVVVVPGLLTAILNEQIVVNNPGVGTSITVRAIHIQLLPALPGLPVIDIILAESNCSAAGSNVLIPQTTTIAPTTTQPPGVTTTTPPGVTTTRPPGVTTTTPPGVTTTRPPGVTTTQPPGVTTTTPGGGGTGNNNNNSNNSGNINNGNNNGNNSNNNTCVGSNSFGSGDSGNICTTTNIFNLGGGSPGGGSPTGTQPGTQQQQQQQQQEQQQQEQQQRAQQVQQVQTIRTGTLARTGATTRPLVLLAMVAVMIGITLRYGSDGMRRPILATSTPTPVFRPVRTRLADQPRTWSGPLDAAAADALAQMDAQSSGEASPEPTSAGSTFRRFLHDRKRPW